MKLRWSFPSSLDFLGALRDAQSSCRPWQQRLGIDSGRCVQCGVRLDATAWCAVAKQGDSDFLMLDGSRLNSLLLEAEASLVWRFKRASTAPENIRTRARAQTQRETHADVDANTRTHTYTRAYTHNESDTYRRRRKHTRTHVYTRKDRNLHRRRRTHARTRTRTPTRTHPSPLSDNMYLLGVRSPVGHLHRV